MESGQAGEDLPVHPAFLWQACCQAHANEGAGHSLGTEESGGPLPWFSSQFRLPKGRGGLPFFRLNQKCHRHQCRMNTSSLYAAAAKPLQSCLTLCDPIDSSPPGSPVPGILQARTLEWIAISFSNAWTWKVKVKLLSCVRLSATPWTAAYQAPPSMGFSRQEHWSGVPLPSPLYNLILMIAQGAQGHISLQCSPPFPTFLCLLLRPFSPNWVVSCQSRGSNFPLSTLRPRCLQAVSFPATWPWPHLSAFT